MKVKGIYLDILAVISGIAMVYAFAPFKLWGLAIPAFSILLTVWSNTKTIKRAMCRGFLFGFGFYGFGSYWQFIFIGTFPLEYQPIMYFLLGGIVLILITFPMLYGGLLVWIKNHTSHHWIIILFPFVWLMGEWVRTWLWTGFPYYQSGYAFVDTPISGFAAIGGELAVTLVVLLLATLLASIYIYNSRKMFITSLCIFISIWLGGGQLKVTSWGLSDAKPLQVRLIHGNPDQEKKSKRYYTIDTIQKYLHFSKVTPRPDLVIWPESSIAIDIDKVKDYLIEEAIELEVSGTSILLGGYSNINGHLFNTFMQASDFNNYYTKRHLIPFGEYTPDWPFIDLKKMLPPQNMDSLREGLNKQSLISVSGVKLATAICYEIIFGEELRQDWEEANILVYISDLSWFKETWGPPQLLQMAQMRALESGKPLLTSTNHGVTGIINNKGEITKRISGKAGYIDGTIIPKNGNTPYTTFGNTPVVLLSGIIVFFGVFWAIFGKRLNYRSRKISYE